MKNDQWSLSRIIKDSISIIFLNFYGTKKKENRRKFMYDKITIICDDTKSILSLKII